MIPVGAIAAAHRPSGGAIVTDGLVVSVSATSFDGYHAESGGHDPAVVSNYWVFDGDDYLTADAASTFVNGMHKAGAAFTIEAWWYYMGNNGNVNPIWDSGTSDQGGSDMSRGVIFGDHGFMADPAGRLGLRIKRDSGGASALSAYLTEEPSSGVWHHHAVSYTGGPGCFLWLDGAVAASNLGSTTWDGTPSSPGSLDPVNLSRIGARGDGVFAVNNGSRLGVLRIYSRALTSAELLQNWNAEVGIFV